MALERVQRIEIARREIDAGRFQRVQKIRPNASRPEAANDIALIVNCLPHKLVDLLHLDDIGFHPGHFADADQTPASVGQPLQLDDQLDS